MGFLQRASNASSQTFWREVAHFVEPDERQVDYAHLRLELSDLAINCTLFCTNRQVIVLRHDGGAPLRFPLDSILAVFPPRDDQRRGVFVLVCKDWTDDDNPFIALFAPQRKGFASAQLASRLMNNIGLTRIREVGPWEETT